MPDGGQPAELQESPDQNARGGRRQVPPNSRGVGAFFTTGKRSELHITDPLKKVDFLNYVYFVWKYMYFFTSTVSLFELK